MLVLLMVVAVAVLPAVIYGAIKLVNRMFAVPADEGQLSAPLDARLRRMEEAIDAMSQQIERLRTGDRYLSGPADDQPLLPPPDDPKTFS